MIWFKKKIFILRVYVETNDQIENRMNVDKKSENAVNQEPASSMLYKKYILSVY